MAIIVQDWLDAAEAAVVAPLNATIANQAAVIADLQAQLESNPKIDLLNAEIAAQKAIIDRIAPGALGVSTGAAIIPWDKNGWRGHKLDLTGYIETFRDDFDMMSVTDESGAGPWYAPVHTDFGNPVVKFRKPSENTGTYSVADSKLRIRMNPYSWKATVKGVLKTYTKATYPGDPVTVTGGWLFDGVITATAPAITRSWESGHIQTMTRDGRGFNQSMGVFEYRCSFPTGGGTNGAPGYWGGPWLLSANEFIKSIGGHLTEIDLLEIYGGDAKGYHTTVHKKPRLVPLPGDFPDRETLSNYTTMNTAKYTDNPTVLMYPGTAWNAMNGDMHTHTVVFDDEWLTFYYDGLSICRYPMLEYWRTPQYPNFSSVLNSSPPTSDPQDVYIDYVRAMKKA